MDFDKYDIEFFESFEGKIYDKVLSEFKSIQNKYELSKSYSFWTKYPNFKKLKAAQEEMENYVNPNRMYERLGVDVLSIHIAENLLCITDPDESGKLLPEILVLRQCLADAYGYIIPSVRVMDSTKVEDYGFEIYVRNKKVYCGKISDDDLKQNKPREIIKSLYKVCFAYVHYIITKTDTLKLMELVSSQDTMLVDDIIPTYISPFDLKHICANLIQRKVGIKDIILVFELLNENVQYTQDINELTNIIEKKLSFEELVVK